MSSNIITSTVSPNGKYIAVSDNIQIKLFEINQEPYGTLIQSVIKIRSFPETRFGGAQSLCFSGDSSKLIIGSLDSLLHIVEINEKEEFTVLQTFDFHTRDGKKELIVSIHASNDGKWICSGDLDNRIFLVNLDTLMVNYI